MKKNLLITCVMLLFAITSMAQNKITISGVVTDKTGETVIGASVRVKGQESKGSITDINGKYQIVDVASNATLIFSYIGMREQEIAVNGRSTINVKMEEDSQLIDEVVVVGYGSAKKRDLTGSIVTVKADEIASKPSTNPLASIQGKVAGVQVVNTGRAGQDPEIRVRGTNSINGFKPLYVVDGLFTDNINYLNTADIESMEILKDPSSLAIFGVRGANGVIIITTKKAKEGQTLVNINTSFGWKHVVDRIKMVNASQFKELYSEQLVNEKNPAFDFSGWNADTDWQDEVLQNGFITNNNISVTGASEKHSFYLGMGYSYEQGNIKHEKFSKITLNASNEYKITDKIKVGFQFNGARMLPADSKSVLNAVRTTPIAPVFNEEYQLYAALPEFQKAQMMNPMVDVDLKANTTRAENYRASGNIYGEVDFLEHFNFRAVFSMDYGSNNGRTYQPIIKVYDNTVKGNVATLGTGKTEVSQFKENETKVQSDYVLTYTNSFGDHNLTATAGFTTYYNSLSRLDAARGQGIGLVIPDNPDKWFVSIGDLATATNGSTQWERTTVSFLGRVIYNYKGKYLFNGSFRRDGSSAFSYTGNQWQNFYSAGAGWLMTEEEFMKDISWIQNLKLRASYGETGSQAITAYQSLASFSTTSYVLNGSSAVALVPGRVPNPDLKWETTKQTDIGIDLSVLGGRISLVADYYYKKTVDLHYDKIPSVLYRLSSQTQNIGSKSNKGWEFSLNTQNLVGDFKWSTSLNIALNREKVLDLGDDEYFYTNGSGGALGAGFNETGIVKVGEPLGNFYGYVFDGIYQNEAEAKALGLTKDDVGSVKFKDLNGDNKITTEDRTIIGNANPDFIFGIGNDFSYKNFDLSFMFQGTYGNDVYNLLKVTFSELPSNSNNTGNAFAFVKDSWRGEGTSNTQQAFNKGVGPSSSRFVEDGSYIRLKNLTFGYTLPKSVTSKWGISNLRFYLSGQNLFTITGYSGYDPEVSSRTGNYNLGFDGGSYPATRSYTFGLNLTL